MIPFKEENGVLVFLKSECDLYGMPYLYGYEYYIVIDDVQEYVKDYCMTLERKLRPIHRYNRKDRFVFILGQLLGLRGEVDQETLNKCEYCTTWEEIRIKLKKIKKSKLYNRIPYIMKYLGIDSPVKLEITNMLFRQMVDDFLLIQKNYENLQNKRKYFPSLRFIAVKIIESYGGIWTKLIVTPLACKK
jgi:hypothetical protein